MEDKGAKLQGYLYREDVAFFLLILLLLTATLLFGGVQEYAKNLAFFIGALSFFLAGGGRKTNFLILIFVPFLLWLLIQLIPLPAALIQLIDARRWEAFSGISQIMGIKESFLTITYVPYLTFKELLVHTTGFFIALVLYKHLDKRRLMFLLYFIIALALIESLYGIYQFVMKYPGVLWERVHFAETARGTFINRNHYAGFLELTAFFAIAYMLSMGRWEERLSLRNLLSSEHIHRQAVLLFISATILTALLLSLSRGGIVSFIGGLVLFFTLMGLRLRLYRRREENGKYEYFLLFALSLAVVAMSWASIGYLQSRFARVGEDAQSRVSVWIDTLKGIGEHPLLGTGGGTFKYAYYMYKDSNRENLVYEHAHNDYLEYAVETGIPGALLFFAPFFIFLFLGVRGLMRMSLRRHSLEFFVLLACISGIFSILIHSLFDFNLQIPANLYFAYALIGIGGAIAYDRHTLPHTSGSR